MVKKPNPLMKVSAFTGPNSLAKCSVDPQADGSFQVTYIPVETGIFDCSVTWNGQDIPG